MELQDLAQRLVDACNKGQAIDAVTDLYAEAVVSIEGRGTAGEPRVEGKDKVLAKNQWFYENHVIHSMVANGPFFPEIGEMFSVYFDMDVTQKWSDERVQMREVALYQVRDSQVVEEIFMFHPDEV